MIKCETMDKETWTLYLGFFKNVGRDLLLGYVFGPQRKKVKNKNYFQ